MCDQEIPTPGQEDKDLSGCIFVDDDVINCITGVSSLPSCTVLVHLQLQLRPPCRPRARCHRPSCRLHRPLQDHMTCSKVPPICHLKGLRPQSTIETEVVNKWCTKACGSNLVLRGHRLDGGCFLWAGPHWATASLPGGWWDSHMARLKLSPSLSGSVCAAQCSCYLSIIRWQQTSSVWLEIRGEGELAGTDMVRWLFPFENSLLSPCFIERLLIH